MNPWIETRHAPPSRGPILLLGPDSKIQRTLVQELHSLPASTTTALDFEDATRRLVDAVHPPSVLLLPETEVIPDEFEEQLSALRIRTRSPSLVPIVFGRSPDAERRHALREAGIRLALFGRFGRHALRFQVNRALSRWATRRPRGEIRAPKEWRTRSFSSGKTKAVRCYSLSSGGAYFVTPRPWVVGSDVALELPIGRDRLLVQGRILYTNVAGAGDGRTLPRGMAITFRPLGDRIQKAIRADVHQTQASLEI